MTTSKQREPMERLVRLAAVLHEPGRVGATTDKLVQVAGFEGGKDSTSALAREIRQLRELGWQIDNIGGIGEGGRYVMTTVDNRLRVQLTPSQQTALLRAVLLANRADLAKRLGLPTDAAPPEVAASVSTAALDAHLAIVVDAVRLRRRLRFRYNGAGRVVHPESVRTQYAKWYVAGCEEGQDRMKWFVVSRMSDVQADAPGTAELPELERHSGLHPMTWEIDPPIEVALRTTADFVPDVRRWLSEPESESPMTGADGEDVVEMVYRVTNRGALRARLYELGFRVQVVRPDEIRHEILDELAEMAGEA